MDRQIIAQIIMDAIIMAPRIRVIAVLAEACIEAEEAQELEAPVEADAQ